MSQSVDVLAEEVAITGSVLNNLIGEITMMSRELERLKEENERLKKKVGEVKEDEHG